MARAAVSWFLRRALCGSRRPCSSLAPGRQQAGWAYAAVEPERPEEMVFVEYAAKLEEEKEAGLALGGETAQRKDAAGPKASASYGALRRQLLALEALSPAPGAELQVTDLGFPAPELPSRKKRRAAPRQEHRVYGTADPLEPASAAPCSGCGALLHCVDPSLAGYLPSEKYKQLLQAGTLQRSVCQRCFLLVHHQKALEVRVPEGEYRRLLGRIAQEQALVLYMLDLLDLSGSLIPDLRQLVGERNPVLVVANKTDLIPADCRHYLKRLRHRVLQQCGQAGICPEYRGREVVHLISAKTGYGIEELISRLQSSWRYKGDVYLVGNTNVGKSTLFNTLLQSDYCKSKAPDVIQRATISRWPGTTLNLLKFPVINPTPYRMFRRLERLKADKSQTEDDLNEEELKHLHRLKKQGYLIGRVGRTFRNSHGSGQRNKGIIEWDPDELSLSAEPEDSNQENVLNSQDVVEFTYNELKDAHWFYDTPGILKQDCILNLLTDQELKIVMPSSGIIPRTYVLQPGMVLFLGALGRIDFLKGEKSAWFSVVASNQVPVHITSLDKADSIYQKHAGKALLGVPIGGEERMKDFPPLESQDIELDGIGTLEAVADIKLSSAGWIAVTAHPEDKIKLRAYTPAGIGLMIEKPPLLPFIVSVKGERIRKTPAYKCKKPLPVVQNL
ncbi:nitric oxide-associated protein 1 isoform X1 [Carcharodon carcharias]|uniref:nitric oxide-associated protein 1 isoform X1 n=1 Tax=Carcharodon carcharias TaxID=13397 RepID=UPI001B7D9E84|nr:nitric oxide-associated protein 1 isoform X1 [Carcharodon carcharias]